MPMVSSRVFFRCVQSPKREKKIPEVFENSAGSIVYDIIAILSHFPSFSPLFAIICFLVSFLLPTLLIVAILLDPRRRHLKEDTK